MQNSLGAKANVEEKKNGPGPGHYEANPNKTYRAQPSFSLGQRIETTKGAETPGPGTYGDSPDVKYKKFSSLQYK